MDSIRADGNARTGHDDPAAAVARALILNTSRFIHRVGVASEGPKLLPFYETLVKWQLLPLYAHILSVTFTVLPQTHNREAGRNHGAASLSLAWASG